MTMGVQYVGCGIQADAEAEAEAETKAEAIAENKKGLAF
jgi:hypothetical protein